MPWIAPAVMAGTSLLGGVMGGNASRDAANTSAQAQLEAARIAAEAAKFRPVGVTTRFGASNFGFDPSGNLSSAGYTVSPELQAYQNRLMGLAGGALSQAEGAQQQYAPLQGAAQGLFGLGQQYLAQSPEQVASDYMARQQNLLAPSRERQMSQLQNTLFQWVRHLLKWRRTTTQWLNKMRHWRHKHNKLVNNKLHLELVCLVLVLI
jgi:hypothetical protein